MDICAGDDIYENYRAYQTQFLEQFRAIGKEYKFTVIDANRVVQESSWICASTWGRF